MEKRGIIAPVTEPTDWISSMVAVKKGTKLCICLSPSDSYKALKRSHYPIPMIEEMLPKLQNAKVFSILDAADGYKPVPTGQRKQLLDYFLNAISEVLLDQDAHWNQNSK